MSSLSLKATRACEEWQRKGTHARTQAVEQQKMGTIQLYVPLTVCLNTCPFYNKLRIYFFIISFV